jgi:hypothetical protein
VAPMSPIWLPIRLKETPPNTPQKSTHMNGGRWGEW